MEIFGLKLDPGTNYIKLVFIAIGLITFLPGLLTNYAEQFIPDIFLRVFRYGRANVSKDKKAPGFLQKIEVPKKWFYHVYICAIFTQIIIVLTVFLTYGNSNENTGTWLTSVLKVTAGNARDETQTSTTTALVTVIFLMQLFRRLYETLCVCVYSGTKMNVIHYFLTYLHYYGCMLAIPSQGPVFYGGKSSVKDLGIRFEEISYFQYAGIIIFFYGSWVQYQAHKGLASLRKGKGNQVVTMKHQIPRGGMFESISCPNYWGEILVYASIAAIFYFQHPTWNFIALWVTANQITTGVMNHRWYLQTFKDYPKNRKAVIPYVW